MIGVITTDTDIDASLDIKSVDSHEWAVFNCDSPFPETMQKLWADIYGVWLPCSGYELVDAPTFLFKIESKSSESYKVSKIYIAVKKRSYKDVPLPSL